MRSDARELWVWNWLPGDPGGLALAGRFDQQQGPDGKRVGRFVYAQSYLDDVRARALDPVLLPLQPREFRTTDLAGIFGVLRDAGPDDWGKRLIDRRHGPQDDLGYLLHARGERTGSIDFSETRDVPPPPPRTLQDIPSAAVVATALRALARFEAREPIPDDLLDVLDAGTSNGGARPKLAVTFEGRSWIAKFAAPGDPEGLPPMPVQECAALDLADQCGIRVPAHRLEVLGRSPALFVERFDRVGGQRLSYASARTVLWSAPEIQRYSFMGSYNNLSRQFGRWIDSPGEARRELYRRVVFNALTGNQDDHDLNHGLVFDPGAGSYGLSPMFDPVDARVRPVRELAMNFGTEGRTISISNLLSSPGDFGMTEESCREAVCTIAATIAKHWRAGLRRHGATDKQIEAMAYRFALAEDFVRACADPERDVESAAAMGLQPGSGL